MLSLETKNILEKFFFNRTRVMFTFQYLQTELCKLKDYHLLCTV